MPLAKKQDFPPAIRDTLRDYRLYLKMQLGKSENTVLSYMADIGQFAEFLAARKICDFSAVGAEDMRKWIELVSSGAKSTTQSRKLSALKSLSGFLLEEKIWKTDYSELLSRPKLRRNIPEVLTREEVEALLEAPNRPVFEELRDRAMLELMYSSGLRVSELCALKFSDFDFDSRILRVCGKGQKVRLIPVSHKAISYIDSYIDFAGDFFKKRRPLYLFATRRVGPLSRKTFWCNIKKYALRAGITKNVKPHILRHSFATHLLNAGANLMAIKEMLGHSDLSTTQIYTHIESETLNAEYTAKHPRSKMDSPPDL